MVLGGETFGRRLGQKDRDLMDVISAPIKRDPRERPRSFYWPLNQELNLLVP